MNRQLDGQLGFLVGVNVLILAAALVFVGGSFVNLFNFQSMGAQVPELGLLSLGVMLAMISGNGGIDLSGIALANLSGVMAVLLVPLMVSPDAAPVAYTLSFAFVALVAGCLGGALNGLLIGYAGLTPIIATLGTQLLFTGIAVGLTGGSAETLGYIVPMDDFGNMPFWGVPLPFALFIAVASLLAVILRFAGFGKRLFLLGSNPTAAFFAGIPVRRMLFTTYMLAGVLASVAGFIIAARTSSVKWDYGTSYVLVAILVVVMAGVRPAGGYGRVICVVLSAIALQMLSSLFNFMSISNFFRDCAWGLLLLLFLASARIDLTPYRRVRS
ncbi:ABC transporter permease [Tianweitania sp. BSSL-BM11]|uniref:ABC transporter permease n=1 Tax=Tianweitania aestuarii TaxID=2814886 RepID=A0ABS5RY77_9HYPH|nr:ABC transporter permease [Tianweitania aestuarii]MBS9722001.1 ABC transporter permease [Tianweitania aestuarii]